MRRSRSAVTLRPSIVSVAMAMKIRRCGAPRQPEGKQGKHRSAMWLHVASEAKLPHPTSCKRLARARPAGAKPPLAVLSEAVHFFTPAPQGVEETCSHRRCYRQQEPSWNYFVRTRRDRKSTRLNSSHLVISYAVFCLKKK